MTFMRVQCWLLQ